MIEAVPCPSHRGSVGIRDSRYPDEVLHASAAEWVTFLRRLKERRLRRDRTSRRGSG
ncbi:MAG: hypothetical protein ACR2MP_29950 [Streptosporangiaceae bacterium]